MDIIRITWETYKWFEPLLTKEAKEELLHHISCFAVGTVIDETACGILLLELIGNQVEGKYLFVAPAYRRMKAATNMIQAVCDSMKGNNAELCFTFAVKEKEEACYAFFSSLYHFNIAEQKDMDVSILLSKISNESIPDSDGVTADYGENFFSLTGIERRRFLQKIAKSGTGYLPVDKYKESNTYFYSCVRYSNEIIAAVFIEQKKDDNFYLNYVYAAQTGRKQLLKLLEARRQQLCFVSKNYPQRKLFISAADNQSVQLFQYLWKQCQKENTVYEAHWNRQETPT